MEWMSQRYFPESVATYTMDTSEQCVLEFGKVDNTPCMEVAGHLSCCFRAVLDFCYWKRIAGLYCW